MVFPNPDRVLLPGQFVTVRFHGVSKPDAILVPQRAVQQGPKGTVVYVIGPGDKVEVRDVKATDWQGDRWLIEEGLRVGERVMVDGFQRVVPGPRSRPFRCPRRERRRFLRCRHRDGSAQMNLSVFIDRPIFASVLHHHHRGGTGCDAVPAHLNSGNHAAGGAD